jgi:hypothetical protein
MILGHIQCIRRDMTHDLIRQTLVVHLMVRVIG